MPKEYSPGTLERFTTAKSHVTDFIRFKYRKEDIEFRELNFQFVNDYEFYLKTVKGCSNNTTLKYIANFKKIVLRAVAKEIISSDPFKLFKGKKTKTNKKPLTREDLLKIKRHNFSTPRLGLVRDIFVFQSQCLCPERRCQVPVQPAAADASRGLIQGVSGYFSKKVKAQKVTLKSSHQVFLVSKK